GPVCCLPRAACRVPMDPHQVFPEAALPASLRRDAHEYPEHKPPLRATRMHGGADLGLGVMAGVDVRDQLAPSRGGVEEAGIEEIWPLLCRFREAESHTSQLVLRQRDPRHQPSEEPRQWHRARVLGRQLVKGIEAVPEILLKEDPAFWTAAAQRRGVDLRL